MHSTITRLGNTSYVECSFIVLDLTQLRHSLSEYTKLVILEVHTTYIRGVVICTALIALELRLVQADVGCLELPLVFVNWSISGRDVDLNLSLLFILLVGCRRLLVLCRRCKLFESSFVRMHGNSSDRSLCFRALRRDRPFRPYALAPPSLG